MGRSEYDVRYRGRRRWNGSHGKLWWENELVFEIQSFECHVEANREDVLIGNSVDSKITSLTGTGTITIRKVINRNFNRFLEDWKAGHDPRTNLVGLVEDPDMIDSKKERISIENVWLNNLDLMSFTKGEIMEAEIPFGFTPEDVKYLETVD